MTFDLPAATQALAKRIPDWRVSDAVLRIVATRAQSRQASDEQVQAHVRARMDRHQLQAEAERLEHERAPAEQVSDAWRRVSNAIATETKCREAVLQGTNGKAVATMQADADAASAEIARTAKALARESVSAGEKVIGLVEALLADAARLYAVARLENGYFSGGGNPATEDQLVGGLRSYLGADYEMRLYAEIDPQILQYLDAWLRRARGERRDFW